MLVHRHTLLSGMHGLLLKIDLGHDEDVGRRRETLRADGRSGLLRLSRVQAIERRPAAAAAIVKVIQVNRLPAPSLG